jgi:F-type H+-transporting ATPase subunit a
MPVKGIVIFVVMIIVAVIFCYFVPFVVLPSIDAAMALPVISVPGEILVEDFAFGMNLTNTIVGTFLADIFVLLWILPVTSRLKKVPGRMQMFIELIFGGFRNLASSIAGPRNGPKLFPLAATILAFLLIANWIELIPGVDSIGLIHCAEEGFNGYETIEREPLGLFTYTQLSNDEMLNNGTTATHADYEACEAAHHGEEHAEDEEHAEEESGEAVAAGGEEGAGGDSESGEAEASDEESAEEHPEDEEIAAVEGHALEDANPNIQIVTPFVRAAATDLNLTLALAVIAVVVVQGFGVAELGWGYPAKFINTPALEKGDVMTFGVGFLELISEISKIISFAFRLFGNIFAGQILLFVIPFLIATLLPGTIYGLEFAVGFIQAAVFAMLFLVFASIAMTGHDDHDEHH